MSKIEKAKNHNGETIFPVTVADAVLMGNGQTLKGKLSELGQEVELFNLISDTDAIEVNNYQVVGYVGSSANITAESSQTSVVLKANKGDVVRTTLYQYSDTSAISFAETLPKLGVSASVLAVGSSDGKGVYEKIVAGTAPSDGYFIVTYLNTYISTVDIYKRESLKKYTTDSIVKLNESVDLIKNFSVKNVSDYESIPYRYINNAGMIVQQTSSTSDMYNIIKPIYITKGSRIKAEFECWSDQCAIGLASKEDAITFKVLQLGKKASNNDSISEYEAVLEEDGFLSISYSNKSGLSLNIDFINIATTEAVKEVKEKSELAESKASLIFNDLDYKAISYMGSDFVKSMGKYIYYDGTIKTTAPSCFISKPLFYEIGDSISIGVKCYGDMATIAKTDNEGAIEKIIMLGGGEDHLVSNHDYYTYTAEIKESGFYVVSGEWTEDVILSYTRKESQKLKDIASGINVDLNLLPLCQFVGLQQEAANGMEKWTGQQVIDNIYEPLRLQYPQYISRKSIGKSGGFDLWVYEFNNSVEEWFSLDNFKKLSDGILLPSTNGLTSKQMAIRKDVFDSTFNMEYKNLYPLSNFSVRKPSLAKLEEATIAGAQYVLLTCTDAIKVTENSVDVYWTSDVKTFDQHCFIISGTHADENGGYLGTALALKYLVEHHSESAIMSYIFNNVKLSVVPILNMWGANQTPKSRTAQDGSSMNSWAKDKLNEEQRALFNYLEPIKDELSFFVDNHTAEWWNNYGYVYAIAHPHQKLMPSITSSANYLCKHWFPNEPALNWNIGQLPNVSVSSTFIKEELGIETATVEFCGQDLMAFAPCSMWDGKYMTFATENYLNFLLSLVAARLKSNGSNIVNNKFFEHRTMQ